MLIIASTDACVEPAPSPVNHPLLGVRTRDIARTRRSQASLGFRGNRTQRSCVWEPAFLG
jgi:hypothetical protein